MYNVLHKKQILIAGASGMVGNHLLEMSINSNEIEKIFVLSRKPIQNKHQKIQEIIIDNFMNYDEVISNFKHIDVVFFCIGVYTGAVQRETFRHITIDYPVALAKAVYTYSPASKFILLSGAGADRTEKSNLMFAKDKGIAENKLHEIYGDNFHSARPGYIYPVVKRNEPNWSYKIMRMIYPVIKMLGKKLSITSVELANAMFTMGMDQQSQTIFENDEMRKML